MGSLPAQPHLQSRECGRVCLREHPAVSGFHNTGVTEDEGQHLQTVYPPAKFYGGPGVFGFSPEAHLTEASPLVTTENRTRLVAEWSRHWDLSRPVLLEKSPPNLIRTRFLQAMLPDACFVIITRHPIPVALATRRWTGTSLPSLVERWLVCHEIFEQDWVSLHRLHTLRCEDFVADPRREPARVCAFVGIDGHVSTSPVSTDLNDRYMLRWRRFLRTPAGAEAARVIRELFAARIERWGYRADG